MSITSLGRIVLVCVAASLAVDPNQAHPSLGQAAAKDALKLATTLNSCVSRGNLGMDPLRSSALASDPSGERGRPDRRVWRPAKPVNGQMTLHQGM